MHVDIRSVQKAVLYGLMAAVTLLFLWIISAFLMPIFWALVFAILLDPLYRRIRAYVSNPSLSALLSIFIALCLILLPLAWLGTRVGTESYAIYQRLDTTDLTAYLLALPGAESVIAFIGHSPATLHADVLSAIGAMNEWLLSHALSFSGRAVSIALYTVLMLYLLFFFLRDSEAILRYISRRLPLYEKTERVLLARFVSTVRATIRGTLIVALVQGLLGGLVFAVAGIDNALFWGAAMAVLSILPGIGTTTIWAPAGLILIAGGNTWQGIVVLAGGTFLISTIDNILRPILVGRETRMPDALVLISILGGIAAFGFAGIVIGPVASALAMSVWDIFAEAHSPARVENA